MRDDNRLIKRMLQEQQEEVDDTGSFFHTVKNMAMTIGVTLKEIKDLPKNQQTKLNERMEKVVNATIPHMKKLRFIQPSNFAQKKYIAEVKGNMAQKILRTRLNMIAIYGNYQGELSLNKLCPHCEEEDDMTEHLLECPVFDSTVSPSLLSNDRDVETWKQIIEVISTNINSRLGGVGWKLKKQK